MGPGARLLPCSEALNGARGCTAEIFRDQGRLGAGPRNHEGMRKHWAAGARHDDYDAACRKARSVSRFPASPSGLSISLRDNA